MHSINSMNLFIRKSFLFNLPWDIENRLLHEYRSGKTFRLLNIVSSQKSIRKQSVVKIKVALRDRFVSRKIKSKQCTKSLNIFS